MTDQPQQDIPEPQTSSDAAPLAAAPPEQPVQIVTGDASSPPAEAALAPIPEAPPTIETDAPAPEVAPTPEAPPVTPTEEVTAPEPQTPDPTEGSEGEGGLPLPPAAA
jgi:hypothetical protein